MLFVFRGACWNAALLAPLDVPATLFSKFAWLGSEAALPANHYTVDVFDYELPRHRLIHDAVRRGEFPWWDPYTHGGRPLAADATVSGTDPLRLLLYSWLPLETGYNWMKLLQSYLLGLGMFLLLGRMGYVAWIRIACALSYQFASNHFLFSTPLFVVAVSVWFPFLWWAWLGFIRSSRVSWLVAMALFVAQAVYAGCQQSHAWLVVLLGGLWLGEVWHTRAHVGRRLLQLAGVLGAGFLLALPVLVPQIELLLLCHRRPLDGISAGACLTGLLSLAGFFPWSLGTFRTVDLCKIAGQSSAGFTVFTGSVGALLAMAGLDRLREEGPRRRELRTALVLVATYLLIASSPLIGLLYARFSDMAVMGLVVLAAEGVHRLAEEGLTQRCRRLLSWAASAVLAVCLAMNLAALCVAPKLRPWLEAELLRREAINRFMDRAPHLRRFQAANLSREISCLNPEVLSAAGGVLALLWLLRRPRPLRPIELRALWALNLLPLLLFASRYTSRAPMDRWHELLRGGPEQQAVIESVGPHGRLCEHSPGRHELVFPGVTAQLFRVHTAQGYSSFDFPDLLSALAQDWPEAKRCEATYTSASRGLDHGQLAVHPDQPTLSRYQWRPPASRAVRIVEESLNRVVLEVEPGAPGVLWRAERHYPGWRVASPPGLPLQVVNGTFLTIQVPANATRLELRYQPRWQAQCLTAAILSACGFLAVLLIDASRARRQARNPTLTVRQTFLSAQLRFSGSGSLRSFVHLVAALALAALTTRAADQRPNIIFILADDLAQGDLGCYGQKLIKTPNLDRMAAEGTRYTQAYCGTTVCAPSRASLMTGLHCGHCPIRANREIQPEGQMPLPAGTLTVARVLKDTGYATACIGKWGMGMFDTTGSPLKVGFDHFFGYNCQRHAHSYFPKYLYNDDKRFELRGNDGKGVGKTYAQNLIAGEVLKWVRAQKDRPFFLFHSVTLPHGRFEIDDQGIYKDKPWTEQQKNYAAMVTRLDSDVGRLLALLKELKLDEKTLVFIAGDNGSSFPPNSELGRHFQQANNGLRGFKRELYEGGLRQAAIARWPGQVPAGRVCDEPWAFWDFLPTAAELASATIPASFKPDGLSLVSFLKGGPAPGRDYFYWELHEGASLQAVRFGDWKAVKNGPSKATELYDLKTDAGETKDLASEKPDLVAKADALMKAACVGDPNWPLRDKPASRKGGGKGKKK